MLVHRTVCSECRVALGSDSGFTVGQPIACPECQEEFVVKAGKNSSLPPRKPVRAASVAVDDEDDVAPSKPKAKSKPAVVIDDDEDDTPPPPKAKSKAAVVIDDEDDEEVVRPKKRARVEVDDDDEEDEDRPVRKKKSKSGKNKGKRRGGGDDEKKSYKNSPIRFVILGLLLVVLAVMVYFLYIKKSDEGKSGQLPDMGRLA